MRELLRRLQPRAWREAHATPPTDTAPAVAPPGPAGASSNEVGLTDLVHSGWFQSATGELFTGVPIEPCHTVVDVGCGDGGYIAFCARRGAHVIAVDIDAVRIERLERQLRESPARHVEAYVSDGACLPVGAATADVVICTEVLEHVTDPAAVLRELARIGKPGARYVLSAPDPVSEELLRATAPAFYFEHPHHIRIIARHEFEQWVAAAGLIVERHDYVGAYTTLFWMALFMVGGPMEAPSHPILHHWTQTWAQVLAHPDGLRMKRALDAVMPRTQVIVARKPEPALTTDVASTART